MTQKGLFYGQFWVNLEYYILCNVVLHAECDGVLNCACCHLVWPLSVNNLVMLLQKVM